MRIPRLLVAVLSAAALLAGPAAASASAATPGYTVQNWSGSGGCAGTHSISPSSTTAGVQLSYALNNGCIYSQPQTWTFKATAPGTGNVTFNWSYTGFHAYYDVTAFLRVFSQGTGGSTMTLVNAGPQNCCGHDPSGGFSYSGTATIHVTKGYAFGIQVGGDNYDSNPVMDGTVTLSVPSGAACKQDGWETQPLVVFRNQGACVSYFATRQMTPIGS